MSKDSDATVGKQGKVFYKCAICGERLILKYNHYHCPKCGKYEWDNYPLGIREDQWEEYQNTLGKLDFV